MSASEKWWEDALCRGQDPWLWDTASLPMEEFERRIIAEERCAGCPVLEACGLDALEHDDRDVIRAAVPLGSHGTRLFGSQEHLRDKLGIPRLGEFMGIAWPRPCGGCGKTMRPRETSSLDYPGTSASQSNDECLACYKKRMRDNGGPDPRPARGPEITAVYPVRDR